MPAWAVVHVRSAPGSVVTARERANDGQLQVDADTQWHGHVARPVEHGFVDVVALQSVGALVVDHGVRLFDFVEQAVVPQVVRFASAAKASREWVVVASWACTSPRADGMRFCSKGCTSRRHPCWT